MKRMERQIARAVLADLAGEVQRHVQDPQVLGKVQMSQFLLAHLLAQQDIDAEHASIGDEVAALRAAEQEEQHILAARNDGSGFGIAVTAEALTAYLRRRLDNPSLGITNLQASLGGFSKQTYLIELSGAPALGNRLVMRRDQTGGPVESLTADEYPVIRLMHERAVPVPEPLWADRDSPFGGTCMFMRVVPGRTVYDVTGTQIGADGKDAALALAQVLAGIHRTPLAELALPEERRHLSLREHVQAMLAFYEAQWQRRKIGRSPTMEAAFAWLHAKVPERGEPALVHGDASLRNLMVADGKASAMLDWELWHVGDYNEDLAYCRADVEQFVPWDVFVAEYRRAGGRAFDVAAGEYYAVFGALRNSVFTSSCLHSFVTAEVPEPKLAYGALSMGRRIICDLAERLQRLG